MSDDTTAPGETVGEAVIDGPIRALEIKRTPDRFEVRVGDQVAFLTFRVKGSVMSVTHTEVAASLRGQGLGEALARAALDDARARGMTVKPYCPFVAGYIESHSEYGALLDPAFAKEADKSAE